MNERKRLYPTVKEERERKALEEKLGLSHTKGGGTPKPQKREVSR